MIDKSEFAEDLLQSNNLADITKYIISTYEANQELGNKLWASIDKQNMMEKILQEKLMSSWISLKMLSTISPESVEELCNCMDQYKLARRIMQSQNCQGILFFIKIFFLYANPDVSRKLLSYMDKPKLAYIIAENCDNPDINSFIAHFSSVSYKFAIDLRGLIEKMKIDHN